MTSNPSHITGVGVSGLSLSGWLGDQFDDCSGVVGADVGSFLDELHHCFECLIVKPVQQVT